MSSDAEKEVYDELKRTAVLAYAYIQTKERENPDMLMDKYLKLKTRKKELDGSRDVEKLWSLLNEAFDVLDTALLDKLKF